MNSALDQIESEEFLQADVDEPSTRKDEVGDFGAEKRRQLAADIDERLKTNVDSIIANRNNIAHGRTSSISIGQISKYYHGAKELIMKLEKTFS